MPTRRTTVAVHIGLLADTAAYAIVLPALSLAHGGGARVGGLFAIYSFAQLFAAPWLGRLSDRVGRRPVLIACQAGTAAGLGLLALPAYPAAVASRLIDGVTAGNAPIAYAASLERTEPARWNARLASLSAAGGAGMLLGLGVAALVGPQLRTAALVGCTLSVAATVFTSVMLPSVAPTGEALARVRPTEVLGAARPMLLGGAAQAAAVLPLPALAVATGSSARSALAMVFALAVLTAVVQMSAVPALLRLPARVAALVAASLSAAGAVAVLAGVAPVGFACLVASAVSAAALARAATFAALGHTGVGTATGFTAAASTLGQLTGPLVIFVALEFGAGPPVVLITTLVIAACVLSARGGRHE